jgi:sulfatase maturation enzyme AslB (radical SAM superfamily)
MNLDTIKNDFLEVKMMFKDLDIKSFIPNQIAGIELNKGKNNDTCGSLEICPRIDKELCVLYNGDVTPCNMFNPYIYGNIYQSSIDEIINSKEFEWFKKHHKQYYYCQNCACIAR